MSQSPQENAAMPAPRPRRLPLAIAWGVAVAIGGGFVTGCLLDRFQMMGAIVLWGLGALAGFVGRRIIVVSCRGVAWGLVAAVVVAWLLGETYWIHGNVNAVAQSWLQALAYLPTFAFSTGTYAALFGGMFAGFGAYSAWWQTVARGSGARAPLQNERIIRGLCPACGYDVRGASQSPACPGCGATLPVELRRDADH